MKIVPFLIFSLFFGMVGCTQPVLQKVNVAEAKTLLAKNDPNLQIVDLRTPGEIANTGAIPGAEFIDFNSAAFSQKVKQLDKKRPVLLYCAVGGRSGQAANMLHKQGFLKVYDFTPGMNGWLAAGNKTSKPK